MNTNFYSLWFDPTGNRTPVYRFSSRRSIHSTTDWLIKGFTNTMLLLLLLCAQRSPRLFFYYFQSFLTSISQLARNNTLFMSNLSPIPIHYPRCQTSQKMLRASHSAFEARLYSATHSIQFHEKIIDKTHRNEAYRQRCDGLRKGGACEN